MTRPTVLIIDNYDSFTYNLYDYFLQLGADCRVVRNNEITLSDFHRLSFDGLVLSPGPQRPANAGHLMALIDYYHDKKPILGICLGHQGIGEYFGGELVRTSKPVHGKTSVIHHCGHPLFANTPARFSVMRYHSLALTSVDNTTLDVLAATEDGTVMAIGHRYFPVYGVQFHPESILTEFGHSLLDNWLGVCHSTTKKTFDKLIYT